MIKIAAYVLQEFGHLTQSIDGKGFEQQFAIIHKHFYNVSSTGRAILFTTYMKLALQCPSVKVKVISVFEQYQDYWEEDIQQRACEYLAILKLSEQDQDIRFIASESFKKLPTFSKKLQTNSILARRILKMKGDKGMGLSKEESQNEAAMNIKKQIQLS
mmetsp:Transcript_20300/g.19229  ORF Transcript_20300/g.19229 Transcript_20300/m.19229 type:complete len:159 (+) Transcript_20300:772-1248(+)